MPQQSRGGSETMGYAAVDPEPTPPVPLRTTDPTHVGPYLLESLLGSGGMGRVYLGRDTAGSGLAAVKVIRPEYAEDPQFRKRFEREVAALGRVQSAHTARLMGSGCEEALVWVATEYIPGPTLAEAVTRRGPVDAAAAWRLMAGLGQAIEAMWRVGIVHRDLKPANVILAADGARLIDFGVVQAAGSATITTTGQNVGTPAFMSPEQVRGHELSAVSDVFSMASAVSYAVTGRAPFGEGTGVDVLHRVAFDPPSEDVVAGVTAVDAELAAFLHRCLEKDPARRPLPEVVVRTATGHQSTGEPAGSPPPGRAAVRGGRRRRARTAPPTASSESPTRPTSRRIGTARPGASPAAAPAPAPGRRKTAPARSRGNQRRNVVLGAAVATLLAVGTAVALLPSGDERASADPGPGPAVTVVVTATPTLSATTRPESSPSAQPPKPARPSPKKPLDPSVDLRSGACPAVIGSGNRGDCVAALQQLLTDNGLRVTVDGRFGARTVTAVRAFQAAAGLTADGRVGAETKDALYSRPDGPVRLGKVSVDERVDGETVAKCLDPGGGSGGADVQVSGCSGGAGQNWALYRVPGKLLQYTIVNQGTFRCLDADAATRGVNGQRITAEDCDGSTAQRWTLGLPTLFGGQTLINASDGFCLDAEADTSGQNGRRVQGWACVGNNNQSWNWS